MTRYQGVGGYTNGKNCLYFEFISVGRTNKNNVWFRLIIVYIFGWTNENKARRNENTAWTND